VNKVGSVPITWLEFVVFRLM